jgi:glycosyltransferase involved in cell wall biosynthesis
MRRLIDVVPFGLSSEPPKHDERVLKGVHSNIASHDKIILWAGGVWEWGDPLTAIRAIARVVETRWEVKLFFMGIQHPNADDVPRMRMGDQALELARRLGLHGNHVFFNDWVPYEKRQNYLLESDIGISLHFDCLETRLSFRTRILDYIWAGLPVITTKGDAMSQFVQRHSLGKVADYEDAEQVATAVLELLSTPDLLDTYRARSENVTGQWTWDRVTRPLVEFCEHPWVAADRGHRRIAATTTPFIPWWLLPAQAWRALQRGGLRALCRGMRFHLRRRFGDVFVPPDRSDAGA